MKQVYPIKPCPWCKTTPKFLMFLDKQTWTPKFLCSNSKCLVRPESQYVSIRKTSKTNPERLKNKIEKLINSWNEGNPINAYEGLEFDFEEISKTHL
jgi:hypothetical protein